MDEISNYELLEKLDLLLPDMIHMRDRLNKAIVDIRLFKAKKGINIDRTKIDVITKCTLNYFNIGKAELRGRTRKGDPMRARQIFCALTRNITRLSFERIGQFVDRNHETVMHSCKVIQDAKDTNDDLWLHYESILKDVTDILDDVMGTD